jgi:serine/threonine-protein kinase
MTASTGALSAALPQRYRLLRHLGEGGMATVYLAEDLKHHRKVALKVLRPELAAIIGAERFLKEIEVTANLQHPNILPLYDSGEADTYLYYVMPYVEGESLRDKLNREKQLPVEETVEIARGVAAALQFAHEHGVIHRDIKPENVLLQSGQPVVADFGIALAISQAGGTRLTETGLSLGTPHYMSPEQASGDRQLDARTDIYSLGAMVYEMLTGDPPYSGNTVQAVVAKILTETPSPISRTRSLVPHNVEAAVEKALAKAPADRFGSAAKFAEALVNPAFTLAHTIAVGVRPAPAAWSWNRLSVLLLALAVVSTAAALWGWFRPAPAKPVSRFSIRLSGGDALAPTFTGRFALSPDGRRMVYLGSAEQGTRLWVREWDALRPMSLPGTDGAQNPFFSPDGSRVGFVTTTNNPRAVKVVSLAGGPPLTITDSLVDLGGASWGRDGYIYFDGRLPGDGIARVPETGGLPEAVTMPDSSRREVRHIQPEALPNGRGVLFGVVGRGTLSGFPAGRDVAVVDLATGRHHVLLEGFSPRYTASGHLLYVTTAGSLMAAPFDPDRLELTGGPVAVVDGVGQRFEQADVAVSTNGTLIYVAGSSAPSPAELVWVTREGTATGVDPAWPGIFNSVSLSPDGRRLAVGVRQGAGSHVWVKQLERGPAVKLTFEGDVNLRPAWTPDGRQLAFIAQRGQNRYLYSAMADGSAPARLLRDGTRTTDETEYSEAAYSADGEWLVYRAMQNLFAVRTRGDTARVTLVVSPYSETRPALSPDGQWLAYASDETGRDEIYVRPFPSTASAKWQLSTNGGTEPVWARSGRELFYKNAHNQLVLAAVLPGEAFTVGEQRVLFSAAEYLADRWAQTYDVAPDGSRFVMIRQSSATGAEEELIVVENFFEELKAKVKRSRD